MFDTRCLEGFPHTPSSSTADTNGVSSLGEHFTHIYILIIKDKMNGPMEETHRKGLKDEAQRPLCTLHPPAMWKLTEPSSQGVLIMET
jgi:hypothetical protein